MRSFLHEKVGGLPRTFWIIWSGTLVNRLGTMVEPFIGLYLTQARGFSLAAAGTVMTLYGAGALLSQVVAGWMADAFGRRVTLSGGMVLTAAAMVALGASTTLPAIATTMFVLGLALDAYRPASQAIIADVVSPKDRPRAYGLLFWAVNLGFAVAMTSAGWLAGAGFSWLFWVDAAPCLFFGALVWFGVRETRPAVRERARGGFRDVLRDKIMLFFTACTMLYTLTYFQIYTTLPLTMSGEGLSPADYGTAVALNGIMVVLIQPLISDRLGRFDQSVVLACGIAVVGAGFALTVLASTTVEYALTVAVWTTGEVIMAGSTGAIVATLAPPHLRGRYSGLYGLAWSSGTLLAPAIGMPLLEIGPHVLWPAVGVIALVAAAGQLALAPAVRRRAAASAADAGTRDGGAGDGAGETRAKERERVPDRE